ncbi:MAG: hypothetical protein ABI399_10495 [Bauldia sp.]
MAPFSGRGILQKREVAALPTETIIVVTGIVAAFLIFRVVLAWVSHTAGNT